MDELELSGRRHISTKRAGQEHGYHSDYIGQLIRAKKVAGQKVGRSWYVDEASLRDYLGKEAVAPAPAVSAIADEIVQPAPEMKEPEQAPEVQHDNVEEEIPPLSEETAQPVVVQKIEEEKIEAPTPIVETETPVVLKKPHTKEPAPVQMGGLKFVADDEPLLPIVRTRARDEENAVTAETYEEEAMSPGRGKALMRATLVAIALLLIAGISAGVSSVVASKIVVDGRQTAAVYYSLW